MPQITEFPHLPDTDPAAAVDALIAVCRAVPADGEPFADFRARLRAADMFDRERVDHTLRFFRMARGATIVPSELMRQVAEAKNPAARVLLADRLWEINPLLFKAVIERVADRVYPAEEIYSYLASFAYRGVPLTGVQVRSWIALARGLGILKVVGIALALDQRGHSFLARAEKLDVDDFLEEDVPEPLPAAVGGPDPDDAPEPGEATDAAVEAPSSAAPDARAAASHLTSPRGRWRPVPVAQFAGKEVFPDEVLAETTKRLEAWWAEQTAGPRELALADFGLDAEAWMERSEEALYRIAVAAALVFRLGREADEVKAAYRTLDSAGVLDDLYYGTAPEQLSEGMDPKALMLASLVARRCAEAPELAAELEKRESGAAAFELLDRALGRGFFKIELFWMMRSLEAVGALHHPDLGDYAALPRRLVRDTLFRCGFLPSPYAHDGAGLVPAAAAARRAAGQASPADEVLAGFALAAGCAFDCAQRRACEHACRERAE